MKPTTRLLITALASALVLPVAGFAAKGEDKKKNDRSAPSLSSLDKDGDGTVSEAEFVAGVKGRFGEDAAKTRFASMDKDKNGKLSAEEFTRGKGGERGEQKKKRKEKN